MQSSKPKSDFHISLQPKLAYRGFKPSRDFLSYKVIEVRPCDSIHEKYMIRILDSTKDLGANHYDTTATLFNQVLLRLQCLHPGSVLTLTFGIHNSIKKIACATLPFVPFSSQIDGNEEVINLNDPILIEKLINQVLSDAKYLQRTLQRKNVIDILSPENICYMKDKGAFFLTNWMKIYDILPQGASDKTSEISALALILFKLKNINCEEVDSIRKTLNVDSETYNHELKTALVHASSNFPELQSQIEKLFSLESSLKSPSFEEIKVENNDSNDMKKDPALLSNEVKEHVEQSIVSESPNTATNMLKISSMLFLLLFPYPCR